MTKAEADYQEALTLIFRQIGANVEQGSQNCHAVILLAMTFI